MHLTEFKKNPPWQDNIITYHLKFSDGYEFNITSKELRDNCPCASCKGEEVLLHKYEPLNRKPVTSSGYELERAVPVGNYAIQLFWKDGHDTGIYTWEHLKKISINN